MCSRATVSLSVTFPVSRSVLPLAVRRCASSGATGAHSLLGLFGLVVRGRSSSFRRSVPSFFFCASLRRPAFSRSSLSLASRSSVALGSACLLPLLGGFHRLLPGLASASAARGCGALSASSVPRASSCGYARPNPSFQGTAGKLRLPVRSGLRPPPAPELERWGSHEA